MVKEFAKNYTKNYLKDKLRGFLITVSIFVLFYFIFDPTWWVMLIAIASYIAIKILWAFVFKRFIRIFSTYKTGKDIYNAIPEEDKIKYKDKAVQLKTSVVNKASKVNPIKIRREHKNL